MGAQPTPQPLSPIHRTAWHSFWTSPCPFFLVIRSCLDTAHKAESAERREAHQEAMQLPLQLPAVPAGPCDTPESITQVAAIVITELLRDPRASFSGTANVERRRRAVSPHCSAETMK